MKREILYISMCFPLKNARHAGGKTVHYYIDSFANDSDNHVTLIAKVLPDEKKMVNSLNPLIRKLTVSAPRNRIQNFLSNLYSANSKLNPMYRYGNVLTKNIFMQIEERLKELKKHGYLPDIVVLEWTPIVLFIDVVKKYFPDAKYVASEHDITFQGKFRKYVDEKNPVKKYYKKLVYKNIRRYELRALLKCNLIVTQNMKDIRILTKNGIDSKKTGVIVPYFEKFSNAHRKPNYKDIIYYGAMNRVENSSCAIWFISNVMPLLKKFDIRFVVIGNRPPKELLDLANERILITGFVEDPSDYFTNAMCMVAPLQLGAGIKVKILEALSSGVPVITNDIGIEGIDAIDGEEYIHCTTPEEYADTIIGIIKREIDINRITVNAQNMISAQYDLEQSFECYRKRVYSLCEI